jgi:F-type H+-transporting ATPase subunit b
MHFDATFWVAVAFVVFVGVVIYFKVPAMLTKSLDERADKIRKDLEEARQLREEAQALLASYERKQRDALNDAKAMVTHATEEAQREAAQSQAKLQETINRREQVALEKIALAEAQAEKEVRDAAVEVAIDAATRVIAKHVTGAQADTLVEQATKDLRRQLH